MFAPYYRSLLERYYNRTYGRPLFTRLASVVFVAGLTVYLGVWTLPWALVWAAGFWAGEYALACWWRRIQPRLLSSDEATVLQFHRELIVFSSVLANIAIVPALLTPGSGTANAVVGVVLSAGCLLILAAQHSLNKMMFFSTAPGATAALVWNLSTLGHGGAAWMLSALGVFFVVNALALHIANSESFNELTKTQIEAEGANRTKGIFLATMGHEIRTPLNGVLGMAQVMAMNELSDEQRERLELIRTSGESLLVLLNDLLDFSKIESGKVELEAIEFNLADAVKSASDSLAIMAEEKGLKFNVDVDGASGIYVGDPTRIRQIVQNLVSNAVKFTDQGEIEIVAAAEDGHVSIAVADTGVGISNAGVSRLFSEFVRADDSTTRQFGGTGLGLAICRDLARLMGGEISVRSELGKGSRFVVELPLRWADGGQDVQSPEAAPQLAGSPADGAALRVLVAEDNPSNRLVLKSLLAHTSTDCTFVENGAQALEAWESCSSDLILMDIQMPVMDGMTGTREIRTRESASGARRTPIYALTADVMSHQTAAHRAAGLDGHIAKPIRVAALFGLLSEVAARMEAASARSSEPAPPAPSVGLHQSA